MIFLILCFAHSFANRNDLRVASRNSFDVPVLALILALLIQIMSGHVYSKASASMAVGALFLGWVFAKTTGASILERPGKNIDYWCMGVVGAMLFQAAIVWLGVFGKDFVHGSLVDLPIPLRAFGAFGQSNQLGVFSVLTLACVYHLFLRHKITESVVWICVAISAVNCALSYSRSALVVWLVLALVAAIPLWRFRQADEFSGKYWRVYLTTCALFISIQLLNFMMPLMPAIAGIEGGQSALTEARSFSSNARWEQIRDSMQLIGRYAYYGVGYEGFAGVRLKELGTSLMEPETTVPHNILFQLFVDFGLIGAAIGLWLTFSVFNAVRSIAFSWKGYSPVQLLAMQWVVGLYVYSMFEFPLLYSYFLLPFMMMIGVAASQVNVAFLVVGRKMKTLLFSILLIGFGMLGLLASDYQRLYTFFHGAHSRSGADGGNYSFLMELSRIQSSSMFQFHANYIWLSVVALNDAFVEEKLEIADFVVRGVPQYQTISRYVAYLVLNKNEKQAIEFLKKFSHRNPKKFKDVVVELERLANKQDASHLLNKFLLTQSFKALTESGARSSLTSPPDRPAPLVR
ncbi:MAG: Wzy polymerase domain-containing protein [Aquabacterium sp.]|uniref:PglL family O-oligosaccharyltransferase n=1 Tax=Aquabacterium sp. TaxID=1872578 RepID=UPI00271B5CDA|nr:Wzy polymerase domain-containing protein [Aquabacterium sp.]MDO9005912.1 Wzy polymerase domain-containing protein [Aquabacterium sp.]